MTSRIKHAYRAIERLAGTEFLEPLAHVERVNELRQSFRPKQTRLLILGESHVRKKDGPGFIYDAAYYTPWWRDLLWPALGEENLTRLEGLQLLRERGVWILDASIIALSGYRNVDARWPGRPLDSHRAGILAQSWQHFVGDEFSSSRTEHVVYFERAAAMLPEPVRRHGVGLRFNGPRHSKALRYSDPDYRFGTARFVAAVRAAGL